MQDLSQKPKHQDKIKALDHLSLGISIVAAILIGVAVGIWLKNITGYNWTLWLGVFWGVGGAILNIYKAYKSVQKDLKKLEEDPKYKFLKEHGFNKIDD